MTARDIAALVPMVSIMRRLGVEVRNRRARCPLCSGRSRETVAFTERLWCCHRCQAGGDIFSLVQKVNGCDFRAALAFVSSVAGVLPNTPSARQLVSQKQERLRVQKAAAQLELRERVLRFEKRDEVHKLERLRDLVGPLLQQLFSGLPEEHAGETEELWARLELVARELPRAVAGYLILAFSGQGDRARFVLRPSEREAMIDGVLRAGFVRDDAGRTMEVS